MMDGVCGAVATTEVQTVAAQSVAVIPQPLSPHPSHLSFAIALLSQLTAIFTAMDVAETTDALVPRETTIPRTKATSWRKRRCFMFLT